MIGSARALAICLSAILVVAVLPSMNAQKAFAISMSPTTDANTLVDTILGPGITVVGDATLIGVQDQQAVFSDGNDCTGFVGGVVLTSGNATQIPGPNTNFTETLGDEFVGDADDLLNDLETEGDSDLDSLTGGLPTFDANVLQFNFTIGDGTTSGNLTFNYAFASEEYVNFVGSEFNDVFGLFVDGVNIAELPDGTPVTINNVNPINNSAFYINNVENTDGLPVAGLNCHFDGTTTVLTAKAQLGPGTHTMKFAVADTSDGILDAGVFIEAGSFSSQLASLTVIKRIVNDDGGTGELADFTLKIDGTIVTNGTAMQVEAGVSHTVSENVSAAQDGKYTATFGDSCPDGVITVQAGQSLVCEITNDDNPPPPQEPALLTVIKRIVNDDGGTGELADFTLRIDGNVVSNGTAMQVEAGVSHTVSENVSAAQVDKYTATFGDSCPDGVITVQAGQSLVCEITNNDNPPPPPPASTPGKITAGGAQVSKDVNFGFVVQSADGEDIKGQLEYQDKAEGINLHSVQMLTLNVSEDGIHGTFSGTATINGQEGYTFTIVVEDNGEPGKDDTFSIVIPELGYEKSGTLVKGNIQIHK